MPEIGILDLLRFAKDSSPKLEVLTPSHLVILLTEGISSGCELGDGRTLKTLTPQTVMVNPLITPAVREAWGTCYDELAGELKQAAGL
jgi:hypothetical protein